MFCYFHYNYNYKSKVWTEAQISNKSWNEALLVKLTQQNNLKFGLIIIKKYHHSIFFNL